MAQGQSGRRQAWLDGVLTFDGRPARRARAAAPTPAPGGFEQWVVSHKIPVGDTMAVVIDCDQAARHASVRRHLGRHSRAVDGVTAVLRILPAPGADRRVAALAWVLRRSCRSRIRRLALLFILNQGYWLATLETLSLVLVATLLSALIGVPVGIAAAHRPRLFAALRPVLDLMQTLPTFVYLIPTLVLFGLGVVPGLISTVIFALPAPIRLTHLGISSVPKPLIEAGEAFGATPMQLLWKVELPSAARRSRGHHPVHHAEPLDGRDRGAGGCRRPRRAGGAGAELGAGRHGLRGRLHDRAARDHLDRISRPAERGAPR
jgi:ABC-type proline/glycine betaine transport system permease subunit